LLYDRDSHDPREVKQLETVRQELLEVATEYERFAASIESLRGDR
jgi:hypothetical protein